MRAIGFLLDAGDLPSSQHAIKASSHQHVTPSSNQHIQPSQRMASAATRAGPRIEILPRSAPQEKREIVRT
eukprot:4035444-Prymnesium_polylepis.2